MRRKSADGNFEPLAKVLAPGTPSRPAPGPGGSGEAGGPTGPGAKTREVLEEPQRGLNDLQIAQLVRDVALQANAQDGDDQYNPISMDEFCYLTGDDCCDLQGLISIYQNQIGDEAMLRSILEDPDGLLRQVDEQHDALCKKRGIPTIDDVYHDYSDLHDFKGAGGMVIPLHTAVGIEPNAQPKKEANPLRASKPKEVYAFPEPRRRG